MSYVIASFNVLKMGEYAVQQHKKDWKLIAKIIKYHNADIVSLQEILSDRPIHELVRCLNMYGGQWDFRFELKETVRNDREGYAFLWNKKSISLLESDGKVYEPHIEAKWSRSLIRPPFVGRFMPCSPGSPFIEIRIINTHIIFNKDKYSKERDVDLSSLRMRHAEYRKLSKQVFPSIAHSRTGDYRVAYTFITGDYNLPLRDCILIDSEPMDEKMTIRSGQSDKTTISLNAAQENPHEDAYANDYDHFSFSNNEAEYVLSMMRIDAPRRFCNGNFSIYRDTVSDHVPVVLKFDLKKH